MGVRSLGGRAVQYFAQDAEEMDPPGGVFLRGSPMFGDVTQDGRTLYMPYQGADSLAVIDTATSEVLRDIPLSASGCLNVHQVELTPDERHGLVVCEGDHLAQGSLLVVDLAEGAVVKSVTVGIFPDSVAILRRNP